MAENSSLLDRGENTGSIKLGEYNDVNVRHGFIRKVFGILFVQLGLTCAICVPFLVHADAIRASMNTGGFMALYIGCLVVTMGAICYMSCNPEVGRKYPTNMAILGVITAGMGVMVGVATTQFTAVSVLQIVALTGIIVFGLMLFAMQTKYDFTGLGPYLFCGLIFLMLFGFVLIFVQSDTARYIRAVIGALLFSVYIIYDTQLIVGGRNKKYQLNVDDYVFGALALYMDIINLFLYLLELFGDRR